MHIYGRTVEVVFTGDMPEITGGIFEKMSKDIVIIGTGKHEYYEDLKQFEESVFKEEEERSQIHFEIESFWCEEKKLNEETSLVHGSVRLKGTGIDENVLIDMDTRFTMIYCKKVRIGNWRIFTSPYLISNRWRVSITRKP